jgi:hypothetical protein
VLGGSGTGEQIVANKIRGIRCVEATEPVTARLGREHNDANVLAMGARILGSALAIGCVEAFLAGEFQAAGTRSASRRSRCSRTTPRARARSARGAAAAARTPAASPQWAVIDRDLGLARHPSLEVGRTDGLADAQIARDDDRPSPSVRA